MTEWVRHGCTNTVPSRVCQCGHIAQVHRMTGRCRVIQGCDCPRFTEQDHTPAMYPTRPAKGREL